AARDGTVHAANAESTPTYRTLAHPSLPEKSRACDPALDRSASRRVVPTDVDRERRGTRISHTVSLRSSARSESRWSVRRYCPVECLTTTPLRHGRRCLDA